MAPRARASKPSRGVHPVVVAIREERTRRGLSLDKLGEMSGYGGNHIWSVETGRISAKVDMIADLAQVMGKKLLLGDAD